MVYALNTRINTRGKYTVVVSKKGYYLIDHDKAWWGYILPIFSWIIPQKVMKINLPMELIAKTIINRATHDEIQENRDATRPWSNFGLIIVFSMGGLFAALSSLAFSSSIILNIIISIVLISVTLYFKVTYSRRAEATLERFLYEKISESSFTEMRMLIFPSSPFQVIKGLFYFSIPFFSSLFGFFHYLAPELEGSNPIAFLIAPILFFLMLNMNGILSIGLQQRVIIWEKK